MAKTTPPSKPEKGRSSQPVIALADLDGHASEELTPLNFRVPKAFHRELKLYAVQHGISMVDLVQESFRFFRDKRGR
jgi:hypothetical protein